MLGRATYIVSGRLGERRVRDELAAKHSIGHEVTTIAGLAARLAGGLLRPVSVAEGRSALQEPPVTDLTSLRDLAAMPGFASAAARTLVAAWHANIVLADHAGAGGRWAELAALERHVAATSGTGALLPNHLIGLARERAHLAAKLTGRITLDRISDVPPLYRGLLARKRQRYAHSVARIRTMRRSRRCAGSMRTSAPVVGQKSWRWPPWPLPPTTMPSSRRPSTLASACTLPTGYLP